MLLDMHMLKAVQGNLRSSTAHSITPSLLHKMQNECKHVSIVLTVIANSGKVWEGVEKLG